MRVCVWRVILCEKELQEQDFSYFSIISQAFALAQALDRERGLDGEGLEAVLSAPAVKAELERRNMSFRLDVVMAYLRRVHFLVFYGGDEFKDEGDLLFSAVGWEWGIDKHWVLGSFCPDRLLRGFTHLIACFTCLKPQLYKRVEPFKPSEKDEKSSGNVDESGTEEGICEGTSRS